MAKQDNYVRYTIRVPSDVYARVQKEAGEKSVNAEIIERLRASFQISPEPLGVPAHQSFQLGDRVEKMSGSSWHGRIVGFYSTSLTPLGCNVESEREPGSVQLYPQSALRLQANEG